MDLRDVLQRPAAKRSFHVVDSQKKVPRLKKRQKTDFQDNTRFTRSTNFRRDNVLARNVIDFGDLERQDVKRYGMKFKKYKLDLHMIV